MTNYTAAALRLWYNKLILGGKGGRAMKITKRNGNVVIYDDEKVVNSILKANAGIAMEEISEKAAAALAGDVFTRLTARDAIISTGEVRDCVYALLLEKGYLQTAKQYMEYKK